MPRGRKSPFPPCKVEVNGEYVVFQVPISGFGTFSTGRQGYRGLGSVDIGSDQYGYSVLLWKRTHPEPLPSKPT